MKNTTFKNPILPIPVNIHLSGSLHHFADKRRKDRRVIKAYLLEFLDRLAENLRIPANFELDILLDKQLSSTTREIHIFLDNTPCSIPFDFSVEADCSAKELAEKIAGILLLNRDLLITETLAEKALWDLWRMDRIYFGSETVGKVRDFFAELVQRGFHIERGINEIAKHNHLTLSKVNFQDAFESAISSLDGLSITVYLKNSNTLSMSSPYDDNFIEAMIDLMKDGLFYELGIVLPTVNFVADKKLSPNQFRTRLNDQNFLPVDGLKPTEFLVNDTVERLKLLGISDAKPAVNPANNNPCAIIDDPDGKLAAICRQSGLTIWGMSGYLILSLSAAIRRLAGSFLNVELVSHNLNLLSEYYLQLVENVNVKLSLETLTPILRHLLDEEISIRDLRSILEALLEVEGTMKADLAQHIIFSTPSQNLFISSRATELEALTAVDYANQVRKSLRRYISHKYTRGQNTLVVYLLDPKLENLLRDSAGTPLAPEDRNQISEAVQAEFNSLSSTAQTPVILTTGDIRKTMLKLIEKELPRLAVLSYTELSPDMNIQPVARISLS